MRLATFTSGSRRRRAITITSIIAVVVLSLSAVAASTLRTSPTHASTGFTFQNSHWYQLGRDDAQYADGAAQEAADNLAYPATGVATDQMEAARMAYLNVASAGDKHAGWQLLGPTTTSTSRQWTYTGNKFGVSGRVTALAIASTCNAGDCRLYLGAAGGGVWRTDDALANPPVWTAVSNGITNAIGSLWVDPTDSMHVLVGTGEPNGSGDSEAGLGLYETHDGGANWTLMPGSYAAAAGRSIGTVAVDPANPAHIVIGTDVARHGSSSANGGRFTPPASPTVGLYESTNGGTTFALVFSKMSDAVNPASPTGADYFRGGVTKVAFDPTIPGRVYFSMFDYGLFRGNTGSGYVQVFASAGAGAKANSPSARTEFALAPLANGKLRVYLGDTSGAPANFYRADDASALALDSGTHAGWQKLSSTTNGTPGYSSYNFCGGQCSYDMPVASPAGHPDNVWIGGQMQYGELGWRSNGRAVQRSTDAGVGFTDMTNDLMGNGMHPDQHFIVFDPENADIAFTGSDGGLVRTSGSFGSQTGACAARGLSGVNLTDCQLWLSATPTQTFDMNQGLATLQFQSLSVNPNNFYDVFGGTQDNGTLFSLGHSLNWTMNVGGDGGQSGVNVANTSTRFHSYYGPNHDVNFAGGAPANWDWISDPLGNTEAASFYVPMIYDPNQATANSIFEGEQHVWRTLDNGGPQAYLDKHCNEFTGDFAAQCGDWVPIGGAEGSLAGDLTRSAYGTDKAGSYVVALTRAAGNTGTLWAGTRRGRLFVSLNANNPDSNAVTFVRIDSPATPTRFISGIALDPQDPNHAFVSFSGYDAYALAAGTAKGHLFEVRFNPTSGTATWTDISQGLGDQPLTGVAFDGYNGDLYVSTDFGVLHRVAGNTWLPAGNGMPLVAVYGLTLVGTGDNEVLFAATHGRGAYSLNLAGEHGNH